MGDPISNKRGEGGGQRPRVIELVKAAVKSRFVARGGGETIREELDQTIVLVSRCFGRTVFYTLLLVKSIGSIHFSCLL